MSPGYGGNPIINGTAFGTPASGIRPGTEGNFPALDAFVIVNGANANRYPAIAGQPLGGAELQANEVQQLLESGITVANKTRSAIRFPYGTAARMCVVVVDHLGKILGIARTRDATIEGAGVALQKTRNAAFLASADAGAFLTALRSAQYLKTAAGVAPTATPSALGTYGPTPGPSSGSRHCSPMARSPGPRARSTTSRIPPIRMASRAAPPGGPLSASRPRTPPAQPRNGVSSIPACRWTSR